jgi:hypothetical protein
VCGRVRALEGACVPCVPSFVAVRGEWREPRLLAFAKGKLYLLEWCGQDERDDDEEAWCDARKEAGKRVFVLDAATGETLQVWRAPDDKAVDRICVCGSTLVVKLAHQKLIALRGL